MQERMNDNITLDCFRTCIAIRVRLRCYAMGEIYD